LFHAYKNRLPAQLSNFDLIFYVNYDYHKYNNIVFLAILFSFAVIVYFYNKQKLHYIQVKIRKILRIFIMIDLTNVNHRSGIQRYFLPF